MSNKIILKKSSVGAKVPLATDLDYGEFALNYADGKLYFKNSSNTVQPLGISYTKVIANTQAQINQGYIANTGAGSFTITLPANPQTGNYVIIVDDGNFNTNPLYVARNSQPIVGTAADLTLDIQGVSVTLIYDGGQWNVYTQVGASGGSGSGTEGQEYNYASFPSGIIPDANNTYALGNASYGWAKYWFGDGTGQTTAAIADGTSITNASGTISAQAGGLAGTTLKSTVVNSSLTSVGTITSGVWQGTVVAGQYGGTGVNNSGKTITLGGNLTTSGAYALTLTQTATTSVTLPTTGTLATLAGTETFTNKTLTSPTISVALDSITPYNLTNTSYFSASYSNSLSVLPMAGQIWHDLLAFTTVWGAPTYETYNGTTWSSATLNKNLFAQKENQSIQVLDGSTILAARWTWSNAGYNAARWLAIGQAWSTPSPNKTILVQSSADSGTTWRTLHTSTYSNNAETIFHRLDDIYGDGMIRLTITWNSGGTVNLSNIKLLTSRPGDQGRGKEYEYPYTWDADKNITIGGTQLSIKGSTSGSTAIQSAATASGTLTLPAANDVLVARATTDTLTNKTIAAGSNTITGLTNTNLSGTAGITNANLANSSVTINGTAVSLGGSATVTAANPNALTIGTGLSGTSYTGSTAVTIAIDSTVTTLTGTQTLTNKTLTTPTINGAALSGTFSGTPTFSNLVTLNYTGAGSTSTLTLGGYNSKGGTGYHDFLIATNGYGSATNPNKWFRLNSTGNLEIVNSAYTNTLFVLQDNGDTTIAGNLTVNGTAGITMPNRPAFRVYGAGTTNINATNTLTSSNFAVDYNQGSNLNTSTGIFTAPVAGLYQINLVARYGGSASISAIQVQKVSGATTTTQVYLEWAGTSTSYHMGGSTVAKLAVGDTLKLVVTAGTVTFDANDCWSVAYIG